MAQRVIVERQHGVTQRANLERPSGLQILELEADLAKPIVVAESQQWKRQHMRCKSAGRDLDFLQRRKSYAHYSDAVDETTISS
jgi:hypothetical protein